MYASTHYIAASGSDASNGTSTSSPWAHAPGMAGCSSSCASYNPVAGDRFIFRGGDTWTVPGGGWWWNWNWGGSNGNPIYIGVDQTWYSGSSWHRPILNGKGADFTNGGFVNAANNYITFDNFEFTGLGVTGQCGWGNCQYFSYNANTYIILENSYFHGWSHSGGANDNMSVVGGDSHAPTENAGCQFIYNVVDGSDSTNGGDSGAAIFHGPPIIHHNIIRYVTNALEPNADDVHDNYIEHVNQSFDPTSHENAFENLGHGSYPGYYYNNVLNTTTAVTWWTCPDSGSTEYVFNNVVYNTDNGNVYNICGGSYFGAGNLQYSFNNTWECGRDSNPTQMCSDLSGGPFGTLNASNNQWVTSGSIRLGCGSDGTCNTTTEILETKSAANAAGYTMANQFAPTAANSPTVGTGTNRTSWCTSIPSAPAGYGDQAGAKAACQQDTTLGVGYDQTNHVVISPNRTPQPRPASGAWDVGAYEFSTSDTPPNPPTGLAATVQ